MAAVDDVGLEPVHAAIARDLLDDGDERLEGMPMAALHAVSVACARGRDPEAVLAIERRTGAVRPAADEHRVEPVLHERGHRVPVERMQPYDERGALERLLLGAGV